MSILKAKLSYAFAKATHKPRMYSNMLLQKNDIPAKGNVMHIVRQHHWIEARQNKQNPDRFDVMHCVHRTAQAMLGAFEVAALDPAYNESRMQIQGRTAITYNREDALYIIAVWEKNMLAENNVARCEEQPFAGRIESPMLPKKETPVANKPAQPKIINIGGGLIAL